ncbi:MAG: glycosyltransferase [Actinomycetota bacterium]|nr:glycosyltransferase [Actinomycetota bacterium]
MIRHVAIVVPANDEQARVGACLTALHRAAAHLAAHAVRPIGVRVVVALDACSDGTAAVVARFPEVSTVIRDVRCVGAARAAGTDAALSGFDDLHAVWTAHTDADSEVPADWLTRMVVAADEGVDLVLGTVVPSEGLPWPIRRTWHALNSAADGHRHVHGANLGIRAMTLVAVGGWRPLSTGEDVDLAGRAAAARVPIRRTGAIAVRTSARADGRAPKGFSSYLRTLAATV